MTSADADYKWVTNDTTISGSISDDDGVKEMTATYRLYDSKTATWAEPVAATVSLSNGSFSVSGLKDGKQIITFAIKDNAGTTFTSHNNETSSYIAPLIQGSDDTPTIYGEAADGDTLVYIKVDNSLPITRDIGFSYYDAKAATPAYVDFSDSLVTLGGARNKLKIQFFAFDENGKVPVELYQKLLLNKLELNQGMIVENIVAQMLAASQHKLYFYSNSDREDASERMEIDFLTAKRKLTSRHNITPIEVKSSQRYTLSSLRKCMEKFGEHLTTPIVLHGADLKEENGILFLPLYMAPLI